MSVDIDQRSRVAAEKNIAFNSLQNRITLVQVNPAGHIIQDIFDSQRIQEYGKVR
jgi:hypothetical protein